MKRKWLAAIGVAALAVVVWLITAALPAPARLFTTLLVVPLPALAIIQMKMLLAGGHALPRLPVYISTSISLWFLASAAITVSAYSGFTAGLIGLRPMGIAPLMTWTVFGSASAIALYAFSRYFNLREAPFLYQLLPRTGRERAVFVFVSFTAGFCEEVVFRGFLIAALTPVFDSVFVAVAVSSVLFGLLHAYQGVIGSVRAGILGLLLAVPFVVTGSLLPAMVAHTLIDLVAGLWLMRSPDPAHALH